MSNCLAWKNMRMTGSGIYQYSKNTNRFFALGEAMTSSFTEGICSIIVCLSAILIVRNRMTIGEMIIFETYIAHRSNGLRN